MPHLFVKAWSQGQALACHNMHLAAQPRKHACKLHSYIAAPDQRHDLGQRFQLQNLWHKVAMVHNLSGPGVQHANAVAKYMPM